MLHRPSFYPACTGRWPAVYDVGPTFSQRCVGASYSLGMCINVLFYIAFIIILNIIIIILLLLLYIWMASCTSGLTHIEKTMKIYVIYLNLP